MSRSGWFAPVNGKICVLDLLHSPRVCSGTSESAEFLWV